MPLKIKTPAFGVDYPNGKAAVDYAYKSLWKSFGPGALKYRWNFYPQYGTSGHPANEGALLGYANGKHDTTARDANGHLLFGVRGQDRISQRVSGGDFFEHAGVGEHGQQRGAPFTQFWYDDNSLAKYMSVAYGRQTPSGLTPYKDFKRWAILGGDTRNWTPYGERYPDTLALDGMYYVAKGNLRSAESCWKQILGDSRAHFNAQAQRYDYPGLPANSYVGLFAILTQRLMNAPGVSPGMERELTQHAISLRSQILDHQQWIHHRLAGWVTDLNDHTSLINIETTSIDTLALGANARASFEAGRAPLVTGKGNYFQRPTHVLSAVVGKSRPGVMLSGVGMKFPTGERSADVSLRAPHPKNGLATVEVLDHGKVIASKTLRASDFDSQNGWRRISVPFNLRGRGNSVGVQVVWGGQTNLDVSTVQIR